MVIWVGTVNRDARVVGDLGAAAGQVVILLLVEALGLAVALGASRASAVVVVVVVVSGQ